MLKNRTIGFKILFGCMTIVALVALAGVVGYRGIGTVGHSLVIVADEEAPVADAAMEMKVSLLVARDAMSEFKGATSVLATDQKERLDAIVATYEQSLEDFDLFSEAILEGQVLADGTTVIKTDNEELAAVVRQANDLHDTKFQAAAAHMMQSGRTLLQNKAEADAAMEAMEKVFDEVITDSSAVEAMISKEIWERAKKSDIGEEAKAILREEVPLADMAMELKIALSETRLALEEFVQLQDPQQLDEAERSFRQYVIAFDQSVQAILNGGEVDGIEVVATDNPEVRAAIEEMDENHEALQQRAADLMKAHRSMVTQTAQAEEAMEALDMAGDETAALLTEAEEAAGAEMTAAKSQGAAARVTAVTALLVIVGLAIVVGIVIGLVLSRRIVGVINPLLARAQAIAAGDLTGQALEVANRDELGQLSQAVNEMSTSLQRLVTEVKQSSNEVASAATEIAASSEEMSQGIQQQTEQTTQVSSAVEEMSSTVIEVARKSADASGNAEQAGKQAEEGGGVMRQTVEGMNAIAQDTDAVAKAIDELGKRSEQIGQIIDVINDIADQTNLLALNAAIEAARAGEHGRGFAVVADEVRKLAERTTQATEEVGDSIKAIQTETEGAVEQMGKSTERVAEGVTLAEQAGERLQTIVIGSQNVTSMIQSIAAAAEEQSAAAEQISRNVESISAVTKQSAEGAGQAASAATQLSSKAEQLQQLVGQFKLAENKAA